MFCAKHAELMPILEEAQRDARRLRDQLNANQRGGKQPLLKALNRECAHRRLHLCGVHRFVGRPDHGCPACNYVALYARCLDISYRDGRDILEETSLAQRPERRL